MTRHRGVSGIADPVPTLNPGQIAGRRCAWCNNQAPDRPLLPVLGTRNPWGQPLRAHGGTGVTCLSWVTADWLARHPDVTRT